MVFPVLNVLGFKTPVLIHSLTVQTFNCSLYKAHNINRATVCVPVFMHKQIHSPGTVHFCTHILLNTNSSLYPA